MSLESDYVFFVWARRAAKLHDLGWSANLHPASLLN